MAKRDAGLEDMLERVALSVKHDGVLAAMAKVLRARFIPPSQQQFAYANRALPLQAGQTISQPSMVVVMLEAIAPQPNHHVLEIGAGSGYVAALLSELVERVTVVERLSEFARSARDRLAVLGYGNVTVIEGDGSRGWPDGAPMKALSFLQPAPRSPSR